MVPVLERCVGLCCLHHDLWWTFLEVLEGFQRAAICYMPLRERVGGSLWLFMFFPGWGIVQMSLGKGVPPFCCFRIILEPRDSNPSPCKNRKLGDVAAQRKKVFPKVLTDPLLGHSEGKVMVNETNLFLGRSMPWQGCQKPQQTSFKLKPPSGLFKNTCKTVDKNWNADIVPQQ